MTNTRCPHCDVLLTLPKYAAGTCEWCDKHLPADLVAHARERVAKRESGHQFVAARHDDTKRAATAAPATPGLMNAGTGLILVMAVIVGLAVSRGSQFFHDLSQPYIYIVAAVVLAIAVGGGMLMTKRVRGRA